MMDPWELFIQNFGEELFMELRPYPEMMTEKPQMTPILAEKNP
ncbi:MAG TPA: hypothetical protein VNM72_00285 [Blastocatellia bacterium]|nr:hypothetical protein [Blastocatellia bacterium]